MFPGQDNGAPLAGLMPPSIWDEIGPHDAYVADSIAKQKLSRGTAENVVQTAMQTGQTVDQQDQARMQEHVAPVAEKLAQMTEGMPDDQFQKLVQQVHASLTGGLPGFPPVPTGGPTVLDSVPGPLAPPTPSPSQALGAVSQGASSLAMGGVGDQTADNGNTEYQNAIQGVRDSMANAPALPQEPALQTPSWLQAAGVALTALMSPRFAGDAATGVFQGLKNEQDAGYQKNVQAYQFANQAYNQNIAHAQALASMVSGYESHRLAVQQHLAQLQQQGDYKHVDQLNRATALYDSAGTYQEKLVAAHNYNSLLRPDEQKLAITDDMAREAGAVRSFGSAAKEFQSSMSQTAKYGEVTDDNAKTLANQRLQIALRYGIANPNDPIEKQQADAAALGPILTGKSYRSMALEGRRDALTQSMQKFNINLDFQRDKWADTLANKQANYDLAVKKLQDFEQWKTSDYALSYDRVAIERQSLKLREDISSAKAGVDAETQKTIRKLQVQDIPGVTAQIATLSALKSPTKSQQEELDKAKSELSKFQGQLSGLQSSLQPTQPAFGTFGGPQVANPTYQGGQQQQQSGTIPEGTAPLPGTNTPSTFTPTERANPYLQEKQREVASVSNQFQSKFGGRYEIPSGAPRNIKGTETPSLHNVNAATDLFPKNQADLPNVAKWATEQPGVQHVIYNRQIWTPSQGWHPYSDKGDPHTDHVHVDYGSPRGGSQPPASPPANKKVLQGKTKSGISFTFTPK